MNIIPSLHRFKFENSLESYLRSVQSLNSFEMYKASKSPVFDLVLVLT